MDTLSLHVMNTDYYIAIAQGISKNWKQPVEQLLQNVASEWSRFQEENELSRLNELDLGSSMELSSSLYDCIKKANDYYIQTQGLFSPYLKKHLEQHGYNQSFPFLEAEKQTIQHKVDVHPPIQFLNHHTVVKTGEQQIDLGGFAKGYIVEKIAHWLQQETSSEYGMVDGGGDIATWSNCDKEWTIGIANPYKEDQEISYIKMKTGSIATSNRVFRSWKQGTQTKHHLLNGHTGEVAKTDVIQASAVTASLCDAEVITKLCFLMTEEELQCWLEKKNIQCARFIIKENKTGYWIKGGK